jgi:N-acylneuraminate cytidylyltransferase
MTGASAVAIIPVRGGSKGISNKNLREIGGRPLLSYTIDAAKRAQSVSRVIVSADTDELCACAADLGAEAMKHPAELSVDSAPTVGVICWVVNQLGPADPSAVFATLRATTPFRLASDIDAAVQILLQTPAADSVVSVVELVGGHPKRLKAIRDGWLVDVFQKEGHRPIRRQELDPVFIRNGGIYASYASVIQRGELWGNRCLPYVMPAERSININTPFDLVVADLLSRHKREFVLD